jgi:hypothetical protein
MAIFLDSRRPFPSLHVAMQAAVNVPGSTTGTGTAASLPSSQPQLPVNLPSNSLDVYAFHSLRVALSYLVLQLPAQQQPRSPSFSHIRLSVLDTLVEVFVAYLQRLSHFTSQSAQMAGRTWVNALDLRFALQSVLGCRSGQDIESFLQQLSPLVALSAPVIRRGPTSIGQPSRFSASIQLPPYLPYSVPIMMQSIDERELSVPRPLFIPPWMPLYPLAQTDVRHEKENSNSIPSATAQRTDTADSLAIRRPKNPYLSVVPCADTRESDHRLPDWSSATTTESITPLSPRPNQLLPTVLKSSIAKGDDRAAESKPVSVIPPALLNTAFQDYKAIIPLQQTSTLYCNDIEEHTTLLDTVYGLSVHTLPRPEKLGMDSVLAIRLQPNTAQESNNSNTSIKDPSTVNNANTDKNGGITAPASPSALALGTAASMSDISTVPPDWNRDGQPSAAALSSAPDSAAPSPLQSALTMDDVDSTIMSPVSQTPRLKVKLKWPPPTK